MREVVLTAASLALTGAVVANAYYQKHQFYPSVVYLTKSSPSMAVLYIQAFVLVILFGKMMRKVFFGQLRAAEMEHLIERSWYAVTETCLAFTVFRDDFSPRFVAQFTLLLFLKCFHWLAEDRIDYMERSPLLTWLFHVRAILLLLFLGIADAVLVHIAYNTVMQSGASVQLVFGFEYAILLTIVVTIQMKYVLHIIDLRSENPWDNKAVYLLYTELITGFIKTILYSCFMVIMIKVHTFPLFAIRPMYLTLRGFKKSISDVIMSRRAIANMNTLYPDATPEELQQGDNVCIICREEMTTGCKKLPCNHIFHTSCLRSWFQRQQTCPTCRMDVLRPPPPPVQQQPPQPAAPPPFGYPPMGAAPPLAPGIPPQGPANVVPGLFPGWPPMGLPPVHVGQPQPPAAAAAPTPVAPATAAPPSTPSAAGNVQQDANQAQVPAFGLPPPFMFPPPFMMPPFMLGGLTSPVNTNFSSMNIEQLVAAEAQERQNVEARINMLRTIHALLDAAIIQLNQYTQMVNEQSQATASAAESSSSAGVSASGGGPSQCNKGEAGPSGLGKENLLGAQSTAAMAGEASKPETLSSQPDPSLLSLPENTKLQASVTDNSQMDSNLNDENTEIRRRRLERFLSATNQNSDQDKND
ncbi:PREDICTED: E3 ubiquitin-protein ligase synoviolin-like isoform X2 [Acropora digitifera]|uniref:E3 ubiquitin-protein ligase synoviolin-like isoform X2 n=1 Tax=Acropora digitifera TaxID=70779 RepID=UPI00077A6180|nr:PREDICTED: E3 ubiquitin-protein ligase synoviolin-like isoform X2 [Acropora digitifera]